MARLPTASISRWALFLLMLALASGVSAQCAPVQVTGTVTDPNGIPYAFGALNVDLAPIPPGGATCTGGAGFNSHQGPVQLSSVGAFNITVPANANITPSGTQWIFSVLETPGIAPPLGFGPTGFSVTLTVAGTGSPLTQSITTQLNSAALALSYTLGSGGSGCVPAGSAGAVQIRNGSACAAGAAVDNGSAFIFSESILPASAGSVNSGSSSLPWGGDFSQRFTVEGAAPSSSAFTLGAGWGNTASVSNITGTDQAFNFTVTSTGTGQAINATILYTFLSPYINAPIFVCRQTGGTGTYADITYTNGIATTTTIPMIWLSTPVAGLSYIFSCLGFGR